VGQSTPKMTAAATRGLRDHLAERRQSSRDRLSRQLLQMREDLRASLTLRAQTRRRRTMSAFDEAGAPNVFLFLSDNIRHPA